MSYHSLGPSFIFRGNGSSGSLAASGVNELGGIKFYFLFSCGNCCQFWVFLWAEYNFTFPPFFYQVMFRMKDYAGAHIEVKAVEDYKFLNSSYVPVLRQLESANLQRFYFENKLENATKDTTNMKFRNPKYLSMLNHLRFYLPEMYPKLHRILFLDDDVVVQRDLTNLWKIDMDGKVNGAVETCFGSFHR
jgi:Glycosyl transferase family 8